MATDTATGETGAGAVSLVAAHWVRGWVASVNQGASARDGAVVVKPEGGTSTILLYYTTVLLLYSYYTILLYFYYVIGTSAIGAVRLLYSYYTFYCTILLYFCTSEGSGFVKSEGGTRRIVV